jgi:DNA ligase-1
MLLHTLVETSHQVAATPGRNAKIVLLATLLEQAPPQEIETTIAYLSGTVRQPKLGVGWATLQAARAAPAQTSTVTVAELDTILTQVAVTVGRGAAAAKGQLLNALFARLTREEQGFVVRLLTGELRQGALEGLMVEALARAAGLEAADVRRAAMLAADLGAVAVAALTQGQLFRPIRPMLAQTWPAPSSS